MDAIGTKIDNNAMVFKAMGTHARKNWEMVTNFPFLLLMTRDKRFTFVSLVHTTTASIMEMMKIYPMIHVAASVWPRWTCEVRMMKIRTGTTAATTRHKIFDNIPSIWDFIDSNSSNSSYNFSNVNLMDQEAAVNINNEGNVKLGGFWWSRTNHVANTGRRTGMTEKHRV